MTDEAPAQPPTYGDSGILESVKPDGTGCVISKKPFSVAGWVKPYILPIPIGSPVNYSYRALRGEVMVTKIQAVQKTTAKTTPAKSSTAMKTGNQIKQEQPASTKTDSTSPLTTPPAETPAEKPVSSSQQTSTPAPDKNPNKVIIPPQTSAQAEKQCSCNGSCKEVHATLGVRQSPPPGIITEVRFEAKVNIDNFESFGVSVTGSNPEIAEWTLQEILKQTAAKSAPATAVKFEAYLKRVFGSQ